MQDLNVCSKRGLVERFDSTIGAGTVLMPFGGKLQLTPSQAMVHKLPVRDGETDTCSFMAWGGNPYILEQSPYHGAYLAVVESCAKLIATGAEFTEVYLSFQEVFRAPRLRPESAGASPWPPCSAPSRRSWDSASPPSAARTPCPAASRISMCRRRSSPLR